MSKSIALAEIDPSLLSPHGIQAVFFDIDGTLLGLDGKYTHASLQQIKNIQSHGVKTAVASGRPYFAARHLVEELALFAPGVFCTGAHIYDPEARQTLALVPLLDADVQALTALFRGGDFHYELYTDSAYYIERNRLNHIRSTHAEHLTLEPIEKNFDQLVGNAPVVKMLLAVDSQAALKHIVAIEQAFPHLQFAYAGIAAHPEWCFASIIDKAACKSAAFDRLLAFHGIAAEHVMCFGDAQSDMVFLQRAGVGIAMGNASDAVKAVAKYVTLPVWEDGVAFALQRFFNMP